MKVILKFSDGNVIEVPDASKTHEFVELVERSRRVNKVLNFENPSSGFQLKRNAGDIVSVEVEF
ncbi:hypothetical protein ERJ70_02890 [Sediminibacillus dalangtanensis]|uniref:DUF2922 domain-containing protein n=1 Tax=Sediminibacillus dalangtanensis TaxID=2729421 RepID=A0ABX7VSB8_9BACI|nr:hypothetical protein [Sediminibacillus dalangtanensis]QTM98353.1 hypothetical protein ERJ70_02890 [Sediminibacillus dalangtanensis]